MVVYFFTILWFICYLQKPIRCTFGLCFQDIQIGKYTNKAYTTTNIFFTEFYKKNLFKIFIFVCKGIHKSYCKEI